MKFNLVLFLFLGIIQNTIAQKPNVIIIMTDDQGKGEFSYYGNPVTKTPNIDKLANESIRMEQFHVAPMCTPTRGQLMSGLDAFRNNAVNVSSGRTLMRSDIKTIADYFKENGYRTALFGKWHLGDNYPFRPSDRGFEETVWFPSSHINSVPDHWNNDYTDDTYIHNGKREAYKGYCTDVFFDEAMKWIEKPSKKPFFVYLAPNAAHSPHYVDESFKTPIRKAVAENKETFKHLEKWQVEDIISFLAQGTTIDENMGKLDRFLQAKKILDNTIIVFLTDNGSTWANEYYTAGMKGRKTTLWEGGHRVPCFIRWQKGNLQPRPIHELCHVQDLVPSLLDAAQIKYTQKFDGISLLPLWKGSTTTLPDRKLVINYSRMPGAKFIEGKDPTVPTMEGAGVLWKNWRFLENKELYNLATDPFQNKDVASQHPEIVQQMREHLTNWWQEVKDQVMIPQRVIIGSQKENPTMLTACEWLGVFIDLQKQVRSGEQKNGTFHLEVAEAGTYTFELRRWAKEANAPLNQGVTEIKMPDGTVMKEGKILPIAKATLMINDELDKNPIISLPESITFKKELKAGNITLKATFLDENEKELLGAYYVYVRRL
jgi:arylsulfatase A-like enzyme